jgi:tripartite-type tricarboxylate transporter receptor subunit TctC
MRLNRRACWGIAAAGLLGRHALAQEPAFPREQVRIVAPFAAGGSSDLIARLLARQMQTVTGKPFVVENLPGGNGVVGTLAVLNAAADGHSFLLGTTTTLSANPYLLKQPPYDAARDFALACPIGISAGCLMVPASSPYRSYEELVADLRKHPGTRNSGWFNASSRIPAALFKRLGQFDFEEVSYKIFGNAISDLRTGLIHFVFLDMVAADQYLASGEFRVLAVSMPQRARRWPDVPAMSEVMPGFETGGYWGVALRSATPRPLLLQINRLVADAVRSEAVAPRLRDMLVEPAAMDLETAATYATAEREKWGRLIQLAGIEPE